MSKKVRATAQGHDGFSRRFEGEVFDMPDGATGSWFEDVEVEKPKAKPTKKKEPDEPKEDD